MNLVNDNNRNSFMAAGENAGHDFCVGTDFDNEGNSYGDDTIETRDTVDSFRIGALKGWSERKIKADGFTLHVFSKGATKEMLIADFGDARLCYKAF